MMPAISAKGASVDGVKNLRIEPPSALTSSSRMIWPVTVVPTFAPTIIPRDCLSEIMPAVTRPEVITMVAVDDWMTAVTITPRKKALTGLFVTFSITTFNVPEDPSFRLFPMSFIPYKNKASPPNSAITLNMFMLFSFLCRCFLNLYTYVVYYETSPLWSADQKTV